MRSLTPKEMETVSGGTIVTCPPCDCGGGGQTKGNNGWGNGPDPTNNGSFHGNTADSKIFGPR